MVFWPVGVSYERVAVWEMHGTVGVEGKVIQINWRSTHLRNSENDVVIIPHSSMAKMRIQNHSAVMARYDANLSVVVDSHNEPELAVQQIFN